MHGGVHPREVRVPCGPMAVWDDVCKQQLLDHDIIGLTGCVPQPPDSVPPQVSHDGLVADQQWRGCRKTYPITCGSGWDLGQK